MIYPPLGAAADMLGGLAAARILSMIFMLGSTVFLYLVTLRLFGRTPSLVACTLWVVSEPALRLAFATYDPLSVLFTALAAWLLVEVANRRHKGELIAVAAISLALADSTAYSAIVMNPVIFAFGFLVWWQAMGLKKAFFCSAWFAAGCAVAFSSLMTITHSWPGVMFSILSRQFVDNDGVLHILDDAFGYSGIILIVAIIGVIIAISVEGRQRALLISLLGLSALVVPLAQLHEKTDTSLDKHLAYGLWLAVMAAGYGVSKLVGSPAAKRSVMATGLSLVVLGAYFGFNGWESAWYRYHTWPNANSFISALRPAVAQSGGMIGVSGPPGSPTGVAEYYLSQGQSWQRWSDYGISVGANKTEAQYASILDSARYGVIALFYPAAPELSSGIVLPAHGNTVYQQLLDLIGNNAGSPGLPALTLAIGHNSKYKLVSVGKYDTGHTLEPPSYEIFAIWQGAT
jgi:hypothetical protein